MKNNGLLIEQIVNVTGKTESETDVIYIQIWFPYYRNASKGIYVKKNVTIPQWLDILAKESRLSYSATFVNGLKRKLGISQSDDKLQ